MTATVHLTDQLNAAKEKIALVRERRVAYETVVNTLIEYGKTYGVEPMESIRKEFNDLFDEALGK